MSEKIQTIIQYLLPKRLVTQLIGFIAKYKGGWITQYMIVLFIQIYKVNMQEAQKQNPKDYVTFNEFLTRRLRNELRPINTDPSVITMPADGNISQIGQVSETGYLLQAKNHFYSLEALLGGQDNIIKHFHNSKFITIYVSPKDYHRIHMPYTGILREALYIPGELFSVNPKIVKNINNIFARNERLICLFETTFGYMAQILIGSTIVGSIETAWLGTVTPPREGIIKHWHYPEQTSKNSITLLKGQEMGVFKMGSTVINLFNHKTVTFNKNLHIHHITKIGTELGTINFEEINNKKNN